MTAESGRRPGLPESKPRRRKVRIGAALAAGFMLGPLAAAPSAVVNAPAAHAEQIREMQYWLEDYGVYEAWETTRGEGVTIAVIDTGIDSSHPVLEDAVTGGTDVSGAGDGDGGPVEQMATGHGTWVASLAAGRGDEPLDWDIDPEEELRGGPDPEDDEQDLDSAGLPDTGGYAPASNSDEDDADDEDEDGDDEDDDGDATLPDDLNEGGVIGIAPEADVLAISVLLEEPNPHGPDVEQQIADAVTWAVDNDADIINMSISSAYQDWPESWDEAFLHAEENDVLVVTSAGNRVSGTWTVGAPGTIPGVLTVAGVDQDREISEDASTQGIAIGVAAPAEPLVGAAEGDGYILDAGTSGASPIVAGAAALIRAEYPDLSAPEVMHRIQATADPAGDSDNGIDPEFGSGILNVGEAVNATDVPEFNAEEHESLEDWIRVHRRGEADDMGHDDIPTDSGIEAGPEGEPRERPQASAPNVIQDWAAPLVLGASALLILVVITVAGIHLSSRRR